MKTKGFWNVLRPIYRRQNIGTVENWQVTWECVGTADSMEEAKSYVKAPVLEVREAV